MATKTIGLTGRDYSTLAAWSSYVNALALSAPEVAEVYKDSGAVADTATVTISGYTGSSGTNTVTLRAASGQGFKDDSGHLTNPLRYDATKGAALTNSSSGSSGAYKFDGGNIIVDGLQFRNTHAYNGTVENGGTATVTNCIVDSAGIFGIRAQAASTYENIAVLNRSTGLGFNNNSGNSTLIGCTIAKIGSASSTGVSAPYGTLTVKNTAVIGFTTDFSGTIGASSTNNATDKGSFGVANAGTSGQVSIVATTDIVNVTNGSENLRAALGSTKLLNVGATVGVGTDIFGTTRPQGSAYDIGAHEYVVAAAGGLPAARVIRQSQSGINSYGFRR